jgi:hypothetical protein
MELLLCLCQTLAGIGYHLFQLPFSLGQYGHIQMLKVLYPIFAVDVEVIHEHLQKLAAKILETSDIVLVNVLVAFFNPNGMTVQSYNPVLVIKAVFFTSSGAIRICQNPDCKSKAVNHVELPS